MNTTPQTGGGELSAPRPPTPHQVLDTPMEPNDSGATTIRGYLAALLGQLWELGDEFSAKQPFGSSGWETDLYRALVKAGHLAATFDLDDVVDEQDADRLITAAVVALGESTQDDDELTRLRAEVPTSQAVEPAQNEDLRLSLMTLHTAIQSVIPDADTVELVMAKVRPGFVGLHQTCDYLESARKSWQDEAKQLHTEVAQLRAGEDETPPEGGAYLTAGQTWRRLLSLPRDQRLRMLEILVDQAQEGINCVMRDHTGEIAELKLRPTQHAYESVCEAVERRRVELVGALGGEPELGAVPFEAAVESVRRLHAASDGGLLAKDDLSTSDAQRDRDAAWQATVDMQQASDLNPLPRDWRVAHVEPGDPTVTPGWYVHGGQPEGPYKEPPYALLIWSTELGHAAWQVAHQVATRLNGGEHRD